MDTKNLLFCLVGVAVGYFIATATNKKAANDSIKEATQSLKEEMVQPSPAIKVFERPPLSVAQ